MFKFEFYSYSSLRQIHGFLHTLPKWKYSHFIAVNSKFEFYRFSPPLQYSGVLP